MAPFVIAVTEALWSASADLSGIGEAIRAATATAAPPTASIVPPALDEVSEAITRLFSSYGQDFQSLSARSALLHNQFVQALSSGGNLYAAAEAANADPLTTLVGIGQQFAVFSPVDLLTGRPYSAMAPTGRPARGKRAVTAAGSSATAATAARGPAVPVVARVGPAVKRACGGPGAAAVPAVTRPHPMAPGVPVGPAAPMG